MMRFETVLAAAAVVALPFAADAAVTVTINDVQGVWTSYSGNPTGPTPTTGTNTLSWGATSGQQSSYVFDGVTPPAQGPYNAGDVFDLGDFTHNNFEISLPSITGANLQVTVQGVAQNGSTVPFTLVSNFQFTHFETPNDASPCGAGGAIPCPDLVTLAMSELGSDNIFLDGNYYHIAVTGFEGMGTSFLTLEDQSNSATLQASFSVVPVPAALPLLFSALGVLGFLTRRRRPSAA